MDTLLFQQKLQKLSDECGFVMSAIDITILGPEQVWQMPGEKVKTVSEPVQIVFTMQGWDVEKLLTHR